MAKPGPSKGEGGRPRKPAGSKLSKGDNAGYSKKTVGPKGDGHQEYVHRLKAGATKGDGKVVDHKSGNKADNSKGNLRKMSRSAHTAKHNKQRGK